jgi:redox-sensitive bicupin YhaK (pirin superfamily)
MIQRIPADRRHYSDFGWLKTYWLFSFDTYHDPENTHWGTLRVFNDDVVDPGMGFPTHPHREMEIVTIVRDGEITHQDSMGHKGVVKAGEVQRMTAGRGITHSEHNYGKTPLHLYQIWIFPREKGLEPGYEQKSFGTGRRNVLQALASGLGHAGAVTMHADAVIYRAQLDSGQRVELAPADGRRVFVYVTAGHVMVNETLLKMRDQARIADEKTVTMTAETAADFIVIDVPALI